MTSCCRWCAGVVIGLSICVAQPVEFVPQTFPFADGEIVRGAAFEPAMNGGTIYTWGDRILAWNVPSGRATVVAEGGAGYGAGGCIADVNADGAEDLIVLEKGPDQDKLVWLEAPDWQRHLIDTHAEFRDCLFTSVEGRPGVLLIHRYSQIRFYTILRNLHDRWPPRELHNGYTPSSQGGLLRLDVDGDGGLDIVFGNYWLRNPASEGSPWRLFAINLWHEEEYSAMARLAFLDGLGEGQPRLVVAQAEAPNARLAVFKRPGDPMKLWPSVRLEGRLSPRFPRALVTGDFDGDGAEEIIMGENAGAGSRLIHFAQSEGRFTAREVGETDGLLGLWTSDVDPGGPMDLVGAGRRTVYWWRVQRRR